MNLENEIAWSLEELFPSPDHPKIANAQKNLMELADNLVSNYKGKINVPNFSVNDLLNLIQEEETFFAELYELRIFSELSFAANMTLQENQELHTKITSFLTDLKKKIAFISLHSTIWDIYVKLCVIDKNSIKSSQYDNDYVLDNASSDIKGEDHDYIFIWDEFINASNDIEGDDSLAFGPSAHDM